MDPLLILLFCYELNLSHTRQFAADLLERNHFNIRSSRRIVVQLNQYKFSGHLN